MPEEQDEGTENNEGNEGEGGEGTGEGTGEGAAGDGKEATGEGEGSKKEVDPDGDKPPVEYKLALPKDSPLAPSVIDEIASYAKEQGLSNEAAQGILERQSKAVAEYEAGKKTEFEKIRDGWKDEVKADKELGGENLAKSAELAQRVVDRFGSKGFKTMLEDTQFGDNPEVIRTFKRIGEMMTDDQFVKSKTQTGGTKDMSDADVIYGKPAGDSSTA